MEGGFQGDMGIPVWGMGQGCGWGGICIGLYRCGYGLPDCHLDRLVSEDHCHSAFVDIEVIGVGHHLDQYSVEASWRN